MFQVMWVKVMEGLTRPGGLVALTFPALEHIVDLEADVIDLRVPLCWHCLWEGPGGKRGSKGDQQTQRLQRRRFLLLTSTIKPIKIV